MTEKTSHLHKGLRVLKALRGHTLYGLSNGQLSQATGFSPSTITRCMQALIDEGLAEKRVDGRFAYSIVLLQIAGGFANEMQRAQDRISELNQRVTVGSH